MGDQRLRRVPGIHVPLNFDGAQQSAIAHRQGSLRVVGGPGTGKTTVLIEHAVARLEEGFPADQLLVLTYGRERAAFLRDEIAARSKVVTREPLARTIHALCYGLLRRRSLRLGEPEPVLVSGPEHDSILRDLIRGSVEEGLVHWPESLRQAATTRGFAREIRDFLSRATERGLNPEELQALAIARHREDWKAVASFYRDYLDLHALAGRNTVDPSALIVDAIAALDDHEFLAETRAAFPLILVDEFQESDPSHRQLLKLIASQVIIAVDPDSAIGAFRGAEPDTALNDAEAMTDVEVRLSHNYRSQRLPHRVALKVSEGFRRHYGHRERVPVLEDAGMAHAITLRSITSEARYIAYEFRRKHLLEQVPWSEMAVVLRAPGMRASALQRAFAAEGIPVAVDATALALAHQPAVAPLIAIGRTALNPAHLTSERAEQLLLSSYGGADQLLLRRMRQEFRAVNAPYSEALIDALLGRDAMSDLDPAIVAPARRIATLISKAREASRVSGAQAENLLWAIWEAATTPGGRPLRDEWQTHALAGGAIGHTADRDLDAVVALFETAARFADRKPGATIAAFFDEIDDQEIPGDTIAARAQRPDVVEIVTVHSSKGRQWQVVAVPGIQEGEFPNLRMRGSLLGSEVLIGAMRDPLRTDAEILQGAFPALLDDERRLFYVATSRARSFLLCTSVDGEEDQPSRFFEEIKSVEGVVHRSITDLPRALSLPGLMGELRRSGEAEAAEVLHYLASKDIPGADPAHWWGLPPLSTDAAIEQRSVSPSAVSLFESCSLRWFMDRHGGNGESTLAQGIGIAVHALAEKMVTEALSFEELEQAFDLVWADVDAPGGWVGERERERAWSMVAKLHRWQTETHRKVVATEAEFDHEIAGVQVTGAIDRIEVTDSGKHLLVDLKTSSSAMTDEKAKQDAQLSLYQLAVAEGALTEKLGDGVDVEGALLLYVGTKTQTARERVQGPVHVEAAKERLVTVALGMNSATFIATPSSDCESCSVRSSCPAMVEGRTVLS